MTPEELHILKEHTKALQAQTSAMLNLEDTMERFIEANSALTGVISRSQEVAQINQERQQILTGTPESHGKLTQIRGRFLKKQAS